MGGEVQPHLLEAVLYFQHAVAGFGGAAGFGGDG